MLLSHTRRQFDMAAASVVGHHLLVLGRFTPCHPDSLRSSPRLFWQVAPSWHIRCRSSIALELPIGGDRHAFVAYLWTGPAAAPINPLSAHHRIGAGLATIALRAMRLAGTHRQPGAYRHAGFGAGCRSDALFGTSHAYPSGYAWVRRTSVRHRSRPAFTPFQPLFAPDRLHLIASFGSISNPDHGRSAQSVCRH